MPREFGMTMKITNRTSRISMSGITFTSANAPRFEPSIEMPMSHLAVKHLPREENSHIRAKIRCLLTGFELGGNQSYFVDARSTHDVDGMRDVGEQYIVIAFDESNFLRAVLEDLLHART